MPIDPSESSGNLTRRFRALSMTIAAIVLLVVVFLIYTIGAERSAARFDPPIARARVLQQRLAAVSDARIASARSDDPLRQKKLEAAKQSAGAAMSSLGETIRACPALGKNYDALNAAVTNWLAADDRAASPSSNSGAFAAPAHFGGIPAETGDFIDAAVRARDRATPSPFALWVFCAATVAVLLAGTRPVYGARGDLLAASEEVRGREWELQTLRRNRALLVATLHGVGDAMIAVDTSGRITFMNPIAERLTGLDESDGVGKEARTILQLAGEKTGAMAILPISQTLDEGMEHILEPDVAVVARDGSRKPVSGKCMPVWDDAREVVGAALVMRDLSADREARAVLTTTEATKEAILESALDCVIVMDDGGRIVEFNPAAEKTFGCARHDAIGRPAVDVIAPERMRSQYHAEIRRLREMKDEVPSHRRAETIGWRKNGEEFPVEASITVVPRVTPPLFTLYMRDITDRKAAQTALLRAKEEAEAESRAKSVFLNDMSDEFRTPLNAVIGYGEILSEMAAERQAVDFEPDLRKIRAAGHQLLTMVNDVLTLSSIEAGKMDLHLETFDIAEMVDDIVRTVQPLMDGNENHLTVVRDPRIGGMLADRTKVRQSVLYLISNAGRFAQRRRLTLEARRVARADGDQLEFIVADVSPGVAGEQMERMPASFGAPDQTRADRFGGNGLGLEIARLLCELMGGEMTVKREPGHGAAMRLAFPARVTTPAK